MSAKSARRYLGSCMVENLFSLYISQNSKNTLIAMKVLTDTVNTSDIPQTYFMLEKFLPRIFLSKCFNDASLPFTSEVRQTEIGHLFEHILLEYLCQIKVAHGHKNVIFNGRTFWNWVKNPPGTFDIVIDARPSDERIFQIALHESITLLTLIMHSRSVYSPSMDFLSDSTVHKLTNLHQ